MRLESLQAHLFVQSGNPMNHKFFAALVAAAAAIVGIVFHATPKTENFHDPGRRPLESKQTEAPASTAVRQASLMADEKGLADASSGDVIPDQSHAPAQYAYLPTEQKFMVEGATNLDAVQVALHQEDFSKVIESFGSDTGMDPSAQDLTQIYRALIEEQVKYSGSRLAVTGFACGLSLCAGSMRYGSHSNAFEEWIQVFFEDKRTPSYNFVDSFVGLSPEENEGRFFFSIDPTLREVRGRR